MRRPSPAGSEVNGDLLSVIYAGAKLVGRVGKVRSGNRSKDTKKFHSHSSLKTKFCH